MAAADLGRPVVAAPHHAQLGLGLEQRGDQFGLPAVGVVGVGEGQRVQLGWRRPAPSRDVPCQRAAPPGPTHEARLALGGAIDAQVRQPAANSSSVTLASRRASAAPDRTRCRRRRRGAGAGRPACGRGGTCPGPPRRRGRGSPRRRGPRPCTRRGSPRPAPSGRRWRCGTARARAGRTAGSPRGGVPRRRIGGDLLPQAELEQPRQQAADQRRRRLDAADEQEQEERQELLVGEGVAVPRPGPAART